MMLFSFKSLQVILPSKACHAIKGILRSRIRVNSLFFLKKHRLSLIQVDLTITGRDLRLINQLNPFSASSEGT